ncbi:tubulin polyglutamylase TTLL6 isoform X2 [Ambystoma mexicanum]|uniref:tubulin polyglutamylase TTLL6 isoform X2 n=2 Tax=Ambystoma mexicanum TaxID=8296 RepID=UPI0037E94480
MGSQDTANYRWHLRLLAFWGEGTPRRRMEPPEARGWRTRRHCRLFLRARMKAPGLLLDLPGSLETKHLTLSEVPEPSVPPEPPPETPGPSATESCESPRTLDANIPRRKKRRKRRRLVINLSGCKYESVRRAARRYGLRESYDPSEWTLFWTDCSVSLDRALEMKGYQKINHFPGMSEICRKDTLARNMSRMQKLYPKEFQLLPRTWCLPADYGDLQAYSRSRKHKTYICKPDTGCQGRGIFITRSVKDIRPEEDMICQLYISKPFIIDGFKFDLRVYVLVTSCDPLRIFVYNEGLARFATTCYSDPSQSNLNDVCMHLTNYSINKHSENFIRDDDSGSKRKLSTLKKYLEDRGYDTMKIWADIEDVIIKTLISAHPIIRHNYSSCFPTHSMGSACFELLGFDILLDRRLRPWLLEVNHSPSFSTDSLLDREVKDSLLYDTLVLINLGACNKRKVLEDKRQRVRERLNSQGQSQDARAEKQRILQVAWQEQAGAYEERNLGGFRRIYPTADAAKYEKFFQQSSSIFQDTAASRARGQCARQQLQELRMKQQLKVAQPKARNTEQLGESAGGKTRSRQDIGPHRTVMAQGTHQERTAGTNREIDLHRVAMSQDTGQLPCNMNSQANRLPPHVSNEEKSSERENVCTDASPLWQVSPPYEEHLTRAESQTSLEIPSARHSSSAPDLRNQNSSCTEHQLSPNCDLQHHGTHPRHSALDVDIGSTLRIRTDPSKTPGDLNLFLAASVLAQRNPKRGPVPRGFSRGHALVPQTSPPAGRWQQEPALHLCEGEAATSLLVAQGTSPLEKGPQQVWRPPEPDREQRSFGDCELLRKRRLGPTEETASLPEERNRSMNPRHRTQSALHPRTYGQGNLQKMELSEPHLVLPNPLSLLTLLVVSKPAPLVQRPGLAMPPRKAPHTSGTMMGRNTDANITHSNG